MAMERTSDYFTSGKISTQLPERCSAPSPFRVDEGYSEEPRSQNGSDTDQDPSDPVPMDQEPSHAATTRDWLLSQPIELRLGMKYSVDSSFILKTSH